MNYKILRYMVIAMVFVVSAQGMSDGNIQYEEREGKSKIIKTYSMVLYQKKLVITATMHDFYAKNKKYFTAMIEKQKSDSIYYPVQQNITVTTADVVYHSLEKWFQKPGSPRTIVDYDSSSWLEALFLQYSEDK